MKGPVLHLAAAPTAPVSIPELFRSEDVKQLIEHPPVTRHDGFNIINYERAVIEDGDHYVIDAWRKRIELYKDGTFIALGTFSELLGWPRDEEDFVRNPKVNSLALIEFTHDFFKTYDAILDYVEPKPFELRCTLGIRGAWFDGQKLWMAPYALNAVGYEDPYERHEAPTSDMSRESLTEARDEQPHLQPGSISYVLIEQLYNLFGMQSPSIPYTNDAANEIDPTTFTRG
jgi:hypothetical protein